MSFKLNARPLLGVLALAACFVAPATAGAVSLQEALNAARVNDPAFRAAAAERKAGKLNEVIGRSLLLPSVVANYSEGKAKYDREFLGGTNTTTQTSDVDLKSYSIQLRQPLYSLDAASRYDLGQELAEEADYIYQFNEFDLIQRIATAYIEVLIALEQLNAANAQKLALAESLKLTQKQKAGGESSRLDVLDVTAKHDLAKAQHMEAQVPCEWLESTEISYTIYTSGTTGRPKGVQRDVGGYAVALAASMKHIYMGEPGETYFSTSDIGWVVGHSYIIYGPLIGGMATIMYEGLPIRPDGGIWWKLVEKYKVTVMFSAPTAVRVLKKQDPAYLKQYDLSSLKALFLAGEPLDEPTARWIADGLGVPIIDNYWQTESGWPILTIANGVKKKPSKFGSPGVPMYGYRVKLLHEATGEEVGPGEKGVVAIVPPPISRSSV